MQGDCEERMKKRSGKRKQYEEGVVEIRVKMERGEYTE